MPDDKRRLRNDTDPPENQPYSTLEFDPDEHRDDISEYYPTKEQQDEVLRILWDIMKTFVDLGWGVESVQMAFPELFENAGADSGKLLEQKRANIFNAASQNHVRGKDEK